MCFKCMDNSAKVKAFIDSFLKKYTVAMIKRNFLYGYATSCKLQAVMQDDNSSNDVIDLINGTVN